MSGFFWNNFFEHINKQRKKCCTVKNLSHDDTEYMFVANICDISTLRNHINTYYPKSINDYLHLNLDSKLFLSIKA